MAKKVEVSKETGGKKGALAHAGMHAHPFLALRDQMDRLFDDFLSDWRPPSLGRGLMDMEPFSAPPWQRGLVDVKFDVSDSDDAIEVAAELPGIDEKDIDLTLSDGVLTLRGEKKAEEEKKERDYYLTERHYGSFSRSLRLPDTVNQDKISARFDKGVLKVTLPKRPEAKAKKKKISISKS